MKHKRIVMWFLIRCLHLCIHAIFLCALMRRQRWNHPVMQLVCTESGIINAIWIVYTCVCLIGMLASCHMCDYWHRKIWPLYGLAPIFLGSMPWKYWRSTIRIVMLNEWKYEYIYAAKDDSPNCASTGYNAMAYCQFALPAWRHVALKHIMPKTQKNADTTL